jgi:hypothetical protein
MALSRLPVYSGTTRFMVRNILETVYRLLYRLVSSVFRQQLDGDPAISEPTARYLRQNGHYTASTGRVKPRAFHPPADRHVSVFRVQGLSQDRIWNLADRFVVNGVQARAELFVGEIRNVGLRVERDEPPPRHANITAWSIEKSECLLQAQELASLARLRLR